MRPLCFDQVSVRNLRVLREVDLEPCAGINIVAGANGQGKTSLLEAIYLVATSRSFRTHKLRECIAHGASAGSVRARLLEDGQPREQFFAVSGNERVLKLDGTKPPGVAAYAVRSPVVVFHPGEVSLTAGPASGRRTLLDRVALFVDPRSYEHLVAYQRALKSRNRLMATEGPSSRALDPYEELLARHGSRLAIARRNAATALTQAFLLALEPLAPASLKVSATYAPGGSDQEDEMLERLRAGRMRDSRRSSPGFGPHLDDLVLMLDDRPARVVGSQGQHRLLTLALKIAETGCVAQATGIDPVLLLDDVSSELDAERTDALFGFLAQRSNQVFVTTTRPEMVSRLRSEAPRTRLFDVVGGTVRIDPGSGAS